MPMIDIKTLAAARAGGSGGGGSSLGTAEETLLASGTLANGTAASTITNTGLTLGDLRAWKVFLVAFKAGQETYFSLACPDATTNRFLYHSNKNVLGICEWLDDARTVARVYYNRNGSGSEYSAKYVGVSRATTTQNQMDVWGYFAFSDGADTSAVNIYNYAALTADVTWQIKGVIK